MGGSLRALTCLVSIETMWGQEHGRGRKRTASSTLPLCCQSFMVADHSLCDECCLSAPSPSSSLPFDLNSDFQTPKKATTYYCVCLSVCLYVPLTCLYLNRNPPGRLFLPRFDFSFNHIVPLGLQDSFSQSQHDAERWQINSTQKFTKGKVQSNA